MFLQTKALAEEGLFDLIGDAWGPDTLNKAHAYIEEEAVEYLPLDGRAFQLAAEGRLEPGGELELTYGKAAVEVGMMSGALVVGNKMKNGERVVGRRAFGCWLSWHSGAWDCLFIS